MLTVIVKAFFSDAFLILQADSGQIQFFCSDIIEIGWDNIRDKWVLQNKWSCGLKKYSKVRIFEVFGLRVCLKIKRSEIKIFP